MSRQKVCLVSDVPENGLKEFSTESGQKMVVANAAGEFFAVQAICPHQDVPLCDGFFDGKLLTCHQHLWQWDIRTGEAVGLAEAPIECFKIKIDNGVVYVDAGGAGTLDLGELFAGLPEPTLGALSALAKQEDHPAGGVLYQVGDPADDFFVLQSGRIEFQIGREDRTAAAGFTLKKGEVFGWAALLESQPKRIAMAKALEPTKVLRLNGEAALKVLAQDPASGMVATRRLAGLVARFLAAPGAK